MNNREIEQLKLFYNNGEALLNHSLIQNNQLNIHTKVNYKIETGWSVSREQIDNELLESLLVRLRRFDNEKDDIHFNKIANILSRNSDSADDIEFLRSVKKLFANRGENRTLKLNQKGRNYSEEVVFDLFVNGRHFHSNLDENSNLEEIESEDKFEYDMFIIAIINKTNAVLMLYKFLENKDLW